MLERDKYWDATNKMRTAKCCGSCRYITGKIGGHGRCSLKDDMPEDLFPEGEYTDCISTEDICDLYKRRSEI